MDTTKELKLRATLIEAIRIVDPDMGGSDECNSGELLQVLVNVTDSRMR